VSAPRSSPIRVLRLADRGGTEHRQAVWWVALTVAVCALVASLLGLLLDEVYVGDIATAAMLRGYDVVTLIVVVPALFLAWVRARGGSEWARLIMASLLLYLAYTYAYYLFGTGFNDLLLLHTVVFSGSLAALILSLVSLDPDRLVVGFSTRTPVRAVATVLGVLAVALGGMWLAVCVNYLLSESPPTGSALVETDTVVKLGIVLDLTVLVPLYLVAAVLLWRRRPWGFVLATLVLVSGVLHQVSYLVALIAQKLAGVPNAVAFDPLEPAILLLYVAATVGLLAGRRRVPASNDGG
jgi:hypothetical protein